MTKLNISLLLVSIVLLCVNEASGRVFFVTSKNFAYNINEDGISLAGDNPTLSLLPGEKAVFDLSGVTSTHPFLIINDINDPTNASTLASPNPTSGQFGAINITLTLPTTDFPVSLYYYCRVHGSVGMFGQLLISTMNISTGTGMNISTMSGTGMNISTMSGTGMNISTMSESMSESMTETGLSESETGLSESMSESITGSNMTGGSSMTGSNMTGSMTGTMTGTMTGSNVTVTGSMTGSMTGSNMTGTGTMSASLTGSSTGLSPSTGFIITSTTTGTGTQSSSSTGQDASAAPLVSVPSYLVLSIIGFATSYLLSK